MNASHTDSESRRARLARWLPAALCLGIAVTQIALTQLAGLSPWLGGGFGMFASLDSPMNRGLTITGLDENGDRVRIMATFSGEGHGVRHRWHVFRYAGPPASKAPWTFFYPKFQGPGGVLGV